MNGLILDQKGLIALIRTTAKAAGIDDDFAVSIAGQETNFISSRCRYEPSWAYYNVPIAWAAKLGITPQTEQVMQATSWGCMQIMGSVARELGFDGYLNDLTDPPNGIFYACAKIAKLDKVYEKEEAVAAAYNAGTPRLGLAGKFVNQDYVDGVMGRLQKLRSIGNS